MGLASTPDSIGAIFLPLFIMEKEFVLIPRQLVEMIISMPEDVSLQSAFDACFYAYHGDDKKLAEIEDNLQEIMWVWKDMRGMEASCSPDYNL